jgi:CheY-like chemotaxis protein
MKIFVADDSAAIQKVVRLAFTGFDCDILVAESAVSLAAMIKQSSPDIVLADPKLAGLDGPESLKSILGSEKVILLLGSYEAIDEALWKQHGFDQTIKKPFVGRVLIELVARLCPDLKELNKSDQGGSFSEEPTRTNQMAMTTLDIDLDFLNQPEESDVQLDVEIPQPVVQAKDKGKKAFDDHKGLSNSDQILNDSLKSSGVPVQQLDLSQVPDRTFERSHDFKAKVSPELDLELGESMAKENSMSPGTRERAGEFNLQPPGFANKSPVHERDIARDRALVKESSHHQSSPVSLDPEALLKPHWPKIQEMIRIEIKQYLDLNFKAQIPTIAKEVIAAEIRRLSEEKARINIDN